jgi:hypothetical protein
VREAPGIRRPQAPDSGIALVVACPAPMRAARTPVSPGRPPKPTRSPTRFERSGVVTGVQRLRRPVAQELMTALLRGPIRLCSSPETGRSAA